jgi:hypothetical protein
MTHGEPNIKNCYIIWHKKKYTVMVEMQILEKITKSNLYCSARPQNVLKLDMLETIYIFE